MRAKIFVLGLVLIAMLGPNTSPVLGTNTNNADTEFCFKFARFITQCVELGAENSCELVPAIAYGATWDLTTKYPQLGAYFNDLVVAFWKHCAEICRAVNTNRHKLTKQEISKLRDSVLSSSYHLCMSDLVSRFNRTRD